MLTRYAKACFPQQAMDEYTPDAWFDVLGDLTLADCRRAVAEVSRHKPFIAPCEIREEVRRIRDERLRRTEIPAPPPELLDNPAAYSAALRVAATAIADGRDPAPAVAAITRQARRELEAS
jgi:hypothetical protein